MLRLDIKQTATVPGWFYGLAFGHGNAEVCLLATRGHPKRQAANIHQFIISPVREHSRKPEEAREKIVALWAICPVWSCSQDSPRPAGMCGMCGEMRWSPRSRTSGQSVQKQRIKRRACERAHFGEPV